MNATSYQIKLGQLAAEVKAARDAWHESYGVPVSAAHARFMDAIGNLTAAIDWIEDMPQAEVWVRSLVDEVANYDPSLMAPAAPVADNEKQVTEVRDEFLRKIFSLAMISARERDRNRLEAAYATDPEDGKELTRSAQASSEKANILFRIFWAYVREAANITDQRMLGMREGWKVVSFDAQRPPSVFEFLFGGPGGPAAQE